jgi:hypothetical protein
LVHDGAEDKIYLVDLGSAQGTFIGNSPSGIVRARTLLLDPPIPGMAVSAERMPGGLDAIQQLQPPVDRRLEGSSAWLRVVREKNEAAK